MAADAGADFRDDTLLIDFLEYNDGVVAKLAMENMRFEVKARYLISADGMLSRVRRKKCGHRISTRKPLAQQ